MALNAVVPNLATLFLTVTEFPNRIFRILHGRGCVSYNQKRLLHCHPFHFHPARRRFFSHRGHSVHPGSDCQPRSHLHAQQPHQLIFFYSQGQAKGSPYLRLSLPIVHSHLQRDPPFEQPRPQNEAGRGAGEKLLRAGLIKVDFILDPRKVQSQHELGGGPEQQAKSPDPEKDNVGGSLRAASTVHLIG